MQPERRTGLSRLWRYTGGRRRRIAVVMVIAAISAAAPVLGWTIVGDAIDNGIKAHDEERLTLDVVAYIAVGLTAWVLGTTTWLMLAGIGQRIVLELRRDLFDHLTSLSLRYFSQQKAGWIIARLTSDVDALSDVLDQGLTTLVVNSLTLLAAIGGLFLLDWRLGVVALVVLPPGVLVTRWFQTASHIAFADVRTRIAAVTAQLAESVAGMAVVQAFNREHAFQREFGDLNEANRVSNVHAQKLSSVFFPAIELLGVIATVAVLFAGAKLIDGGSLQIGTLIAAIGMLQLVFQPLQELSELYGQVQAASAAMTKISTVLDAEHDITDKPGAPPRSAAIAGHVELDDVVFAYGDEPVIHGISIDVPEGGCIALVGESGGGKSTTAKLIARFYDPDRGRGPHRRHRPARRAAALGAAAARRRAPGSVPLQRHDRRQHPLREARGHRRGGGGSGARDRRRPDHGPLRRRPRPRRPRGRRRSLCGRAAADLDRARPPRRSTHPHPRRGDVEHRPPQRDPDRAGVRHAPARPDLGDHRPPARHRPAGATRSSCSRRGASRSAGRRRSSSREEGPFRRLAQTLDGASMRDVA